MLVLNNWNANDALFWASIALLAPQGMYVRWNAPRLSPAPGPFNGTVGKGNEQQLLAIGDSIVAGVGASSLEKALVGQTAESLALASGSQVHWNALGGNGFSSADVIEHLLPQVLRDYDYILVSVGVNDLTKLEAASTWRNNALRLLSELLQRAPLARIAISGLPPLGKFPLLPQPLRAVLAKRASLFDRIIQNIAAELPNVVHVPISFEGDEESFASDGYHPSEQSYHVYGLRMADALRAVDREPTNAEI